MKTAVSVPDPVFRRAERAAKQLGISRSELFTRALVEFLETQRSAAVKESYDRGFGGDQERPAETRFRRAAARRTLLKVEW